MKIRTFFCKKVQKKGVKSIKNFYNFHKKEWIKNGLGAKYLLKVIKKEKKQSFKNGG